MQSRKAGLIVAGLGVAAAIVLFIVLNRSDEESEPATTAVATTGSAGGSGGSAPAKPATIVIKDGEPVGGVQDLTFQVSGRIQFIVRSDENFEIHFHGYDIAKDVKAGGQAEFNAPATSDGVYEVEIEDTATQIAEITVNP